MSGWDSLSWEAKRGAVLTQALFVCEICQNADARDVDHIWPKSKGGTDDRWNLRAACKPCNQSKSDQIWFQDLEADTSLALHGETFYRYGTFSAAVEGIRWTAFLALTGDGMAVRAAAEASVPNDVETIRIMRRLDEAIDEESAVIAARTVEVEA